MTVVAERGPKARSHSVARHWRCERDAGTGADEDVTVAIRQSLDAVAAGRDGVPMETSRTFAFFGLGEIWKLRRQSSFDSLYTDTVDT